MIEFSNLEQFSSTDAKQRFGALLKAARAAPVAIEKHGKVQAVLGAPEFFSPATHSDDLAARRLARLNQAMVEKDRLIRHQKIALDLATLPAAERAAMVKHAKAVVEKWRAGRLCSADYIERWSQILALPAKEMAQAMASDADGWGASLRQNSPWVGIHA